MPQPTTQPAARADLVAAPRVVQAGYQTSQQQLNLPQIAFELARQSSDGNTRFQIRLDPAELGRIDVRLDIDSTGQVNARLTVEKAETLDLMQRDQRALERALQQAGLDGAKTSLEFSLRQNSSGQQGQPDQRGHTGGQATAEAAAPPPTINLYRGSFRPAASTFSLKGTDAMAIDSVTGTSSTTSSQSATSRATSRTISIPS